MSLRAWLERPAVRLLLIGSLVGLIVLGIGGRIAMALIQAASNTTPSRFTVGGTMTVIALGGASGLAGAAITLTLRRLLSWPGASPLWHVAAFAAALVILTERGLRGTPVGRWYFYPLVAIYAGVTLWLDRRTRAGPRRSRDLGELPH